MVYLAPLRCPAAIGWCYPLRSDSGPGLLSGAGAVGVLCELCGARLLWRGYMRGPCAGAGAGSLAIVLGLARGLSDHGRGRGP